MDARRSWRPLRILLRLNLHLLLRLLLPSESSFTGLNSDVVKRTIDRKVAEEVDLLLNRFTREPRLPDLIEPSNPAIAEALRRGDRNALVRSVKAEHEKNLTVSWCPCLGAKRWSVA